MSAPRIDDGDAGSAWRCAECGHGEHLSAWAHANAYGPLTQDGARELAEHVEVWETHVYEDSIQCDEHPDARIEERQDSVERTASSSSLPAVAAARIADTTSETKDTA